MKQIRRITFIIIFTVLLLSCKISGPSSNTDLPGDNMNMDIISSAEVINSSTSLTVDYPYVFSSDGLGRITVIDAFIPWNLNRVSTLKFYNNATDRVYDSLRDQRNMLYAALGNSGLFILNTSNPVAPTVHSVNANIAPKSLDIDENNVYSDLMAVAGEDFWKIYEVIGAGQLLELSSSTSISGKLYNKVKIKYPYMYVGSNFSIDVYDITNPFLPSMVRSVPVYYLTDFDLIGTSLIAITSNQLIFFDNTQPEYLNQLTYYILNIPPVCFSLVNGHLLIAYENKKLVYYQISDISAITEIAYIQFNSFIQDIKYYDDYYYLANSEDGVVCMQLTDLKKQMISRQ